MQTMKIYTNRKPKKNMRQGRAITGDKDIRARLGRRGIRRGLRERRRSEVKS